MGLYTKLRDPLSVAVSPLQFSLLSLACSGSFRWLLYLRISLPWHYWYFEPNNHWLGELSLHCRTFSIPRPPPLVWTPERSPDIAKYLLQNKIPWFRTTALARVISLFPLRSGLSMQHCWGLNLNLGQSCNKKKYCLPSHGSHFSRF